MENKKINFFGTIKSDTNKIKINCIKTCYDEIKINIIDNKKEITIFLNINNTNNLINELKRQLKLSDDEIYYN